MTQTGETGPRIALVFPPAMSPTSPPLGVAALKSCLEAQIPSACVRVFDLNLAHYAQAEEWLASRRLKMSLRKMGHAETAAKLRETIAFFRGAQGLGAFCEIERYNAHAALYSSFETVLNGLFDDFARKRLAGLSVPPLGEAWLLTLIEPVLAFKPDLAGFSLLFSQQLTFALALAALCREAGIITVLGGATLSVMPRPETLLSPGLPVRAAGKRRTAGPQPVIDYLIAGEGEAGLGALAQSLGTSPSALAQIPGLIYPQDGEVKINPPDSAAPLDSIPPPDFSDFDLYAYHSPHPVLPYLSARGCYWKRCAFCTHQKTYLAYREEAVEATAAHLALLRERYGVSHFALADEMIHPRRFLRLAKAIREKAGGIFFSAYAKPSAPFLGIFEELHATGLRVVMWGVESGSQRVLDAMRKGARAADTARVLDGARRAGIWSLAFVLFGFPSETAAEWQETVDFLDAHGGSLDALSRSRFVLLEGSDVFLHPEKYGVVRITDRPERDPVSVAYDYEVSSGLSQTEVAARFPETRGLLSRIGRSPYFAQFRDHMLIHAASEAERTG